ncbi:MAG: hypothetical protein BGO43_15175 [Gammaproteobacteria bacterium 39-13]|nr:DUF2950 family protein [Gammaproteobacteria bacterium]OJV87759.1 MAG: hypothetical protein BGO43_15175 [Gammaproteobacteria bacterium 39-13]
MHQFIRNFCVLTATFVFCAATHAAKPSAEKMHFATPEEAIKTLVTSVKDQNKNKLIEILGTEAKPLIESGDTDQDQANRQRFINAYDEGNKLEKINETEVVLSIGKNNWPFPIPLMQESKGWYFDTNAGKEEILNRRIGGNELTTIKTLLTYVNPQERSSSPLEEEFKNSNGDKTTSTPEPYFGYLYRFLDNTTEGYSLVAWPITYGNTGVMTFVVNKEGKIYEKDLGPNTKTTVNKITKFNPDKTWKEVKSIDK